MEINMRNRYKDVRRVLVTAGVMAYAADPSRPAVRPLAMDTGPRFGP